MLRTLILCCLVTALTATFTVASAGAESIDLSYEVDGTTYTGQLFLPANATAPVPGVLVIHEWWGLNDYARRRASELADAGYAAFACDMFGTPSVDTPAEAGAQAKPLYEDRSLMRNRSRAALDALANHEAVDSERLGAIGFCFGGTVTLELIRSGAPVDAAVSFHGGLATPQPAEAGAINGRVLVCHGGADPMVPPNELADFMTEMETAGANYQLEVYGGAVHAFTNPGATERGIPGVAYDANAEASSIVAMLSLFSEALGQ